MVGAGGVGRRLPRSRSAGEAFEQVVLADVALERARAAAERLGEPDRFAAERVDASSREELVELIGRVRPDAVLNACDPRFNEPIFARRLRGEGHLSGHGDDAVAPASRAPLRAARRDARRPAAGRARALGAGGPARARRASASSRACRTSSPRYAADELFSSVEEVGVRDGADLVVEGYDFAPTFSIWTTIEECLNPPLIWERERGFYTTAPFSEPEVFEFPEGIGPVECVNVEHEEVVLIPRWVDCERVTFKYGLGQEFIDVLRTLHKLGLDSTEPVSVRGTQVAPRDVVAAALPDPGDARRAHDRPHLRRHVGHGHGQGRPARARPTSTTSWTTRRRCASTASQAVVWQTAINPVVALELLDAATGRAPACSAPRRSRRRRSSSCWRSTAHRTGSQELADLSGCATDAVRPPSTTVRLRSRRGRSRFRRRAADRAGREARFRSCARRTL